MSDTTEDISLYAGETKTVRARIFNGDDPDEREDLTGCSATFIVKDGSTTLFTKTVGSGIAVDTAEDGRLLITLSAANTSSLIGNYPYELRVTLADGTIATTTTGTITVLDTLTA